MAPVQERVQLFTVPGFPSIKVTKLVDAETRSAAEPGNSECTVVNGCDPYAALERMRAERQPVDPKTDPTILNQVNRLAERTKELGLNADTTARVKAAATNFLKDELLLGGGKVTTGYDAVCIDGYEAGFARKTPYDPQNSRIQSWGHSTSVIDFGNWAASRKFVSIEDPEGITVHVPTDGKTSGQLMIETGGRYLTFEATDVRACQE